MAPKYTNSVLDLRSGASDKGLTVYLLRIECANYFNKLHTTKRKEGLMEAVRNHEGSKIFLKWLGNLRLQILIFAFSMFSMPAVLSAKVFHIASGDVTALIAAINEANSRGGENTIILKPGVYTLTKVDNGAFVVPPPPGLHGPTGLPVITSALTLRGDGAEFTSIARHESAPAFRILFVSAEGNLTVEGLTITGGLTPAFCGAVFCGVGAGIRNEGAVTIKSSIVTRNRTQVDPGGGLFNRGTMIINESTIARNSAFATSGAGIVNGGSMTISKSSISNNTATDQNVGGIINGGNLLITNSTIANNRADLTGGIENRGVLNIINSTVAGNMADGPVLPRIAGINNQSGTVNLQNSILAENIDTRPGGNFPATDCAGSINSLGNNIIGNPTGCAINLLPTDLTGDARLGTFIDDGTPGNGRIPLLPDSRLIDTGNAAACTALDQLDTPRNGRCDIGAVEFYPVINGSVEVRNSNQIFNPSPVPGAPAGTLRITAHFVNISDQIINNPFAEVLELSGGNLLLNADGGAGGKGARVSPQSSANARFQPAASRTFEFLIGLQRQESFTFLVNIHGSAN
jgi:hypothetical protein